MYLKQNYVPLKSLPADVNVTDMSKIAALEQKSKRASQAANYSAFLADFARPRKRRCYGWW